NFRYVVESLFTNLDDPNENIQKCVANALRKAIKLNNQEFLEIAKEVEKKTKQLSAIIHLYPSILKGQTLEKFEDFFERINDIPEIREILRNYRTPKGQNLLEYYKEKILTDKNTARKPFRDVIESYLKDGILITGQDLDITVLDNDFYLALSAPFFWMKFKQFLLEYRNKKNEDLIQIITRGSESRVESIVQKIVELLKSIQRSIDDDRQFLQKLLAKAAPETKPADVMLMETEIGRSFLTKLDPQYYVKADSYGITPLMRDALEMNSQKFQKLLSFLREKGVTVQEDQKDLFGNTIASLRKLKEDQEALAPEKLLAQNLPFKNSIWNDIRSFPYRQIESGDYLCYALRVVSVQNQTSLHNAFFQRQSPYTKEEWEQVNGLWRGLFKAYDDLVDDQLEKERPEIEELRKNTKYSSWKVEEFDDKQSRAKEEKELPLAARYLKIKTSPSSRSFIDNNSVSKVLAGNSTFGINFSRKATNPEAKIIVKKLRLITRNLNLYLQSMMWKDDPGSSLKTALSKKISSLFFQDYPFEIAEENKPKLLAHQRNLAIVTLEFLLNSKAEVTNAFGIKNDNQKFEFIDQELQSKVPVGVKVNSRARFERLNALYPEAFSADAVY
ncbi:MAG: hypothetical protein K2Q34_00745, partial [Alphaproteobacteria bacterium]|nr:hypothetical protein [Alphaproteobacteria bacterium]